MTSSPSSPSAQPPGNASVEQLILGVDGGGTKTEVWLAAVDARAGVAVLGRGHAGSSNPRAVGLERALANLAAAIDAAWADARRTPVEAALAVLAISGAGHASVREQIINWARTRRLAADIRIEHDAEPVLAAGTPDGWGVGLIVGTGSVAIGVDPRKQRHVVGGWGYWFGDEGSAYWIGRRALAAVARADDGRAPPTALTAALAGRLKVEQPRAMLSALEQAGDVRHAIAALAETVVHVAEDGDEAAGRIVQAAADELADLVRCAAERLSMPPQFPLALAGGAVCGSRLLREALMTALVARALQPQPVRLVEHPVEGCLRLAQAALSAPRP